MSGPAGPVVRGARCRLWASLQRVQHRVGRGPSGLVLDGLDKDQFDLFCDHLIVEDHSTRQVVGTYRMQSGAMARRNVGYYSEQEFDFTPYEILRGSVLELGRASIDRDHRSSEVLILLWRGIVRYCRFHQLRYLVGCSSLTSHDPQAGWAVYSQLSGFLVEPEFRTSPTEAYELPPVTDVPACMPKVPTLLKTYIGVGAGICGAPTWDREFGTIDYLTLLDLEKLTRQRGRGSCATAQSASFGPFRFRADPGFGGLLDPLDALA